MLKDIAGYEGLYKIGRDGVVVKRDGTRLLGSVNSYGYRVVSLTKNGKKKDHKVHRLLAKAFIPNPSPGDFNCVNHIDGNKLNNSLENLEWCTRKGNNQHARDVLCCDYSEKPVVQFASDGKMLAVWRNASAAASVLGGAATLISACCKGTADSAYGFGWGYASTEWESVLKAERLSELENRARLLQKELDEIRESVRLFR